MNKFLKISIIIIEVIIFLIVLLMIISLTKLDIKNPIIRINTVFKDYSSTKKQLFYHEFTMIE